MCIFIILDKARAGETLKPRYTPLCVFYFVFLDFSDTSFSGSYITIYIFLLGDLGSQLGPSSQSATAFRNRGPDIRDP